MTTNPVGPAPTSTLAKVLADLQAAGGYVSLGVTAAGVLIPLVKGAIAEIKKLTSPQGVVTYQVVITTDASELDSVVALADADLTALNEYLASVGAPPVPVTPAPADPLTAG
jgi:hypothetical protein